jgi:hypothetical protein
MNTKYTPAPWTFSKWEQFGRTSFYICQQDGAPYTPNYSDVASCIAETVSSERVATQEANARLIAAAPELLEAIKGALGLLDGIINRWPRQTAKVNAVHAAIAKAEGGAA